MNADQGAADQGAADQGVPAAMPSTRALLVIHTNIPLVPIWGYGKTLAKKLPALFIDL